MEITNCSMSDADEILSLYDAARNLQAQRKMVIWPTFARSFIEKEIQEKRQWKIICDTVIACNWTIAFEDKQIWGEKDQEDSIYIHRICTNSKLRGKRYIDEIVKWSEEYAKQIGKRYIRLDTLGNNTKLIEHYTSAGFVFLGMFKLTDTTGLPDHYRNEPNCCLFEINLESADKK